MIPFSSRIQFGFLCAVSLSQQVATHCGADPEGEQQLPEQMQLSVVSGGCKCSLWKLFDVTDLTMNQEGKEETCAQHRLSTSANDLCLVRCKCMHSSALQKVLSLYRHACTLLLYF